MLFAAHSGLRYLVLVAGLFVVLYALVGFFGKREYSTAMARLATVFTGLMHLQVLTGVATLLSRPFYTQMIGHFFLMLLAAAVAQFTTSVTKRRPPEQRSYGPHLVGGLVALALVAAGTMAIGRGVLQSTM
ncbi:MAG: hypothetical protein OXN18_03835 [Gemmatimonadota bacterium]|nr:hypothetical protein [Gemmatimonadota bacterium]